MFFRVYWMKEKYNNNCAVQYKRMATTIYSQPLKLIPQNLDFAAPVVGYRLHRVMDLRF